MVDKNIIKSNWSDRLNEIDEYVDTVKTDYIHTLIKTYSSDLKYYKYIDTVEEFSLLNLKGSIKYINKFDKKLRTGGLLVKIYKDEKTKKWIGIVKKSNKKYYISYDSNYIFYMETQDVRLSDSLKCFVTDLDKGLYELE